MKSKFQLRPLLIMIASCAVLLLLFYACNANSAQLRATAGSLEVDAATLGSGPYVLTGDWARSVDAEGRLLYTLQLHISDGTGLCLRMSFGEGLSLTVNGTPISGAYALAPGDCLYTLCLTPSVGSQPLRQVSSVTLSTQDRFEALLQANSTQLLFLAGIAFGILLYALSLYFQKQQERYLLVLAIMVYSTFGRSLVYALPAVESSALLRALLLDVIYFPFLSRTTSIHLNWLFIAAFLAALRYRLLSEFASPRVGKAIFGSVLGGFALLILCSLGASARARYLLMLFEIVIFALEACSISQMEGARRERGILSAAWALTVASWCLVYGVSLGLIPHGFLDLHLSLRGITVLYYELAFMIVINGKFARKFAEADTLAAKLEKANGGLESAVAEKTLQLKASYDAIASVQKQRDEFVRSIVHSLKSILFSVGGYADMALSELPSDPQSCETCLKLINENTDFAKEVIETLSSSLHMAEGQVDYHVRRFDMHALLNKICEATLNEAKQVRILLSPSPTEAALTAEAAFLCTGDPFYIRQAIQNLVDNAVRHSKPGCEIRLALTAEATGLHISVQDFGEGIAQEALPHIFDAYYSANQNRHASNGLGLTIAKSIVERHGGSIEVQSELGVGSLFTLFFPHTPPGTEAAFQSPAPVV